MSTTTEPNGPVGAASTGTSPAGSSPGARKPLYGGTLLYGEPVPGDLAGEEPSLLGDLNLHRIVAVIRRKWYVVAGVVVLGLLASYGYIQTITPIYEAECFLELSLRRPQVMDQRGAVLEDATTAPQSDEIFNTRLQTFRSKAVLDAAVSNLVAAEQLDATAVSNLAGVLSSGVSFDLVRKTRLVRIGFSDPRPVFAADAVNAYADGADAVMRAQYRGMVGNALSWLQDQANSQQAELKKADQDLLNFNSENKISSLESRKRRMEEAILMLNNNLSDLQGQALLTRDLLGSFGSESLTPELAGRLPASVPRPERIQTALDRWTQAQVDRDVLLVRYTPRHPAVQAQERTINVLSNQVVEAVRSTRDMVAANLALLDQQIATLQKRIQDASADVAEVDLQITDLKTRLDRMQQERDVAEASYRNVLRRIEEVRLSADDNALAMRVIERAAPPEEPARPKKLRLMAAGLMLSLVAGLGLAILVDSLEDHVMGLDSIEQELGLKILGMVLHVQKHERKDLATASMNERFSQVAEAFAGARGVLDSAQYKDMSHVVMVASTVPEEGKTITCSNLAIMCAKAGQRTLLVDFDLRRPRIGRIFGMPEEKRSLLHEICRPEQPDFASLPFDSSCENLQVIGSRPDESLSPAEIMGSRRVKDFIAWARSHYDRVIIDSPPVGMVSDSVVLAGLADGVIMVFRPNRSRKKVTLRAVRHFAQLGVSVIGVIVNDVGVKDSPATSYQAYNPNYR